MFAHSFALAVQGIDGLTLTVAIVTTGLIFVVGKMLLDEAERPKRCQLAAQPVRPNQIRDNELLWLPRD